MRWSFLLAFLLSLPEQVRMSCFQSYSIILPFIAFSFCEHLGHGEYYPNWE